MGSSPTRLWSRCWAPPGRRARWRLVDLLWALPSGALGPRRSGLLGCCVCGPPVRVCPSSHSQKKEITRSTHLQRASTRLRASRLRCPPLSSVSDSFHTPPNATRTSRPSRKVPPSGGVSRAAVFGSSVLKMALKSRSTCQQHEHAQPTHEATRGRWQKKCMAALSTLASLSWLLGIYVHVWRRTCCCTDIILRRRLLAK